MRIIPSFGGVVFPALALFLVVLAIKLLGDLLQDGLNPELTK